MPADSPVERNSRLLGAAGETVAGAFLKRNGFIIIDRNVRTPFGEIDLIAQDRDTTVFIEVKTRVSESFGSPALSVTAAKRKHIIKNAIYYCKRHRLLDENIRIDVISINLAANGAFERLEHMKNAVWTE